jgi:hypothetical protein
MHANASWNTRECKLFFFAARMKHSFLFFSLIYTQRSYKLGTWIDSFTTTPHSPSFLRSWLHATQDVRGGGGDPKAST